jgi:hypothetical protein
MKSSPCNYITNITHIHMKKSMHINESIQVTITHVKENIQTANKGGKRVMCGDNDHAEYIYMFIQ